MNDNSKPRLTVTIAPRKKRAGYSTTYDVSCAGFREVINFPTYAEAANWCRDNGLEVYRAQKETRRRGRCVIVDASGRITFDSRDRMW